MAIIVRMAIEARIPVDLPAEIDCCGELSMEELQKLPPETADAIFDHLLKNLQTDPAWTKTIDVFSSAQTLAERTPTVETKIHPIIATLGAALIPAV